MRFQNKVALITGSARGLGAGIAFGLAREGARVVINYLHPSDYLDATLERFRRHGLEYSLVQADVSREADVLQLISTTLNQYGHIDLLVNNAGFNFKKPFLETDCDEWDHVLDTNLKSMFMCSRLAVPHMPRGGAILNLTSVHSHISTYNFSIYAASKGGIEALTRNMAIELGELGIRVNGLRPGFIVVENEPFDPSHPDYHVVCERFPLRRVGQIQDIVGPALLLLSDDAAYITGEILTVDGGMSIMVNTPFPRGYAADGARQEDQASKPDYLVRHGAAPAADSGQ